MIGVLRIQFFVLLCTGTYKEFVHGKDVNVTYITDVYSECCGKSKCNNKREEKSNVQSVSINDSFCPDCSCHVSCFIKGNCCPDVFFDYEPTCTITNILSWNRQTKSSKAIQMIAKCPTDSDEEISKLCNISSDLETQLQNIPVTSGKSGFTFRNIYCLMCFNDSLEYAIPWSLEIDCEEEGNLNFITNYSQIIKHAKSNKCDIFYYTSPLQNYTRSCKLNKNIISTCNVSGTWKNYDFNIEYACQTYDNNFCMFKNIYCYMCNPSEKSDVITGSNITACLSSIKYLSDSPEQFYSKFSLRNLHVYNFYKDSSYKTKVFDPNKNKYRNIMCYPGRVLTSDGCVPLLQTTRNLGYIVSLELTSELASDIIGTVPFLKSVKTAFRKYLKSLLDIRQVNFTSSIYWANPNCADNIIWQSDTELNISVYQKILILDYIDRFKVEQKLISIFNSNFVVAHDLKNFTFKVFKNVEALSIESYSSTMGFVKSCFLIAVKEDSFLYSNVNSLLTCPQIELEMTEFRINSLKLTILAKSIQVEYDEFIIMSSGKARICLETFRYIFIVTHKTTSDHDVLREIIQVIFTCTSLVCLVITFITYCIFPSLRTLPGQNNMCLVFAIFQCHLFFQFSSVGAKTQTVCMIIGALLHYFWLAIFSCLNVCSFHMYRVFTSKTVLSTSENKRLITYIVYSYGIPLVIVLSNIVFTYIFSEQISIGYGDELCFLNHDVSFIYTLVVPISIVCCTNLFFFTVSALHIKRLTIDEGQNEYNRMHTIIYVKLFSVTCIIWIYQIINTFLPMSEFSTVMTVLNGLYGIFIFWSFICNRRILDLLVKRRFRFRMHVTLTDSRNQPKLSPTSIELNAISLHRRNQ